MKTYPIHKIQKFAEKTLLWYPMDTQQAYEHNKKHRYSDLERLDWVDAEIRYSFNKFGFRGKDFIKPDIVFMGCSIPFGIGLNDTDTVPSLLSLRTGLEVANISLPGTSNDTAFRLSRFWLPEIKPKIAILLSPDKARLELLDGGETIDMRCGNQEALKNDFFRRWISTEDNAINNQHRNILAIENLCMKSGIKFICLTIESDFIFEPNDFARDLSHPGRISHLKTTEKIMAFL